MLLAVIFDRFISIRYWCCAICWPKKSAIETEMPQEKLKKKKLRHTTWVSLINSENLVEMRQNDDNKQSASNWCTPRGVKWGEQKKSDFEAWKPKEMFNISSWTMRCEWRVLQYSLGHRWYSERKIIDKQWTTKLQVGECLWLGKTYADREIMFFFSCAAISFDVIF